VRLVTLCDWSQAAICARQFGHVAGIAEAPECSFGTACGRPLQRWFRDVRLWTFAPVNDDVLLGSGSSLTPRGTPPVPLRLLRAGGPFPDATVELVCTTT